MQLNGAIQGYRRRVLAKKTSFLECGFYQEKLLLSKSWNATKSVSLSRISCPLPFSCERKWNHQTLNFNFLIDISVAYVGEAGKLMGHPCRTHNAVDVHSPFLGLAFQQFNILYRHLVAHRSTSVQHTLSSYPAEQYPRA